MSPTQRMESAFRANPDIGRYRLADEAGVGEKTARLFLERQKSSMVNVVPLTDWHVPYHDERTNDLWLQENHGLTANAAVKPTHRSVNSV